MANPFTNLTPEQLEALSSQLSPETADALRARVAPASPVQEVSMTPIEQLSAESQMLQPPMTPAPAPVQPNPLQAAEVVRNDVLQNSLGLSSAQNIGKMQDNLKNLQSEQEQIEAGIGEKYAQEEAARQLAAQEAFADEQRRIMEEKARMVAIQKEQAAIQKKQASIDNKRNELEQNAARQVEEDDESPFKKNSFLLALAVGLGGYAGAMTGQENPALRIINARMDEIARNKKLKSDEKLARQRAELDKAELEIKQRTANIAEREANAKIAQILNEIQLKKQDIAQKLQFSLQGNVGIPQDAIMSLPSEEAERYIGVPILNKATGAEEIRYFQTLDKQTKQKVSDRLNEMESADKLLASLEDINAQVGVVDYLGDKVGLSTLGKEAQAISEQLVGKLRLELFGPGVMTDTERNAAKKILASPMTAYAQFNKEGNQYLLATIKYRFANNMREEMRRAGAQVPESVNEYNVNKYIKANSDRGRKITTSQAIDHLMKAGKWLENDYIELNEGE